MTNFELVDRPAQPTAVVHERVPMKELHQFFARAFGQVFGVIQAQGVVPAGPPFGHYFGMPGETVDVEAGFPVAGPVSATGPVQPSSLPGGRCAHGTHVGPYEGLNETYGELMEWMAARHVRPAEDMWESYLSDPQLEPDSSTWRTEIFWPVA